MKTITIYELLGLIKDGKAPNKIKWNNEIWTFVYKKNSTLFKYNYTNENNEIIEDYLVLDSLEDEVEILDEEDEFIEIEKIVNQFTNFKSNEAKFKILVDLINDLVHNQKMLIDKMKEK